VNDTPPAPGYFSEAKRNEGFDPDGYVIRKQV